MLTAWKTDKGGNELENTSKWEVEYISTTIDSTWIRFLDENKRIVLEKEFKAKHSELLGNWITEDFRLLSQIKRLTISKIVNTIQI